MTTTILHALASYWRRNLLQLMALLIGLIVATALFSGVQALNAQAKASYERAARTLSAAILPTIETVDGSRFSDSAFGNLRRNGWEVSPVLEGKLALGGQEIRVIGIEPISLPAGSGLTASIESTSAERAQLLGQFLTPPGLTLLNEATLQELGVGESGQIVFEDGRTLPPLMIAEHAADNTVIVDIGIAQALLKSEREISRLIVDSASNNPQSDPAKITGLPLMLKVPEETADLSRLTDSFHLNLTAFGLLAFLVGLFIVYSGISLAFQQRMSMFRTLRACGVSSRRLTLILVLELVSIAVIAGIIGIVLGYLIAAVLLPNVAVSLQGLYGAQIDSSLSLKPIWWLSGIGLSIGGALIAGAVSLGRAYRMSPLASAHRIVWEESQRRLLFWQAIIALALLSAVPLLVIFGEGQLSGFAAMAGLLLGGALLLPPILGVILRWSASRSEGAITEWFWADSRQQLSGISMALMALLLALSANIGVGTMVEGFRQTFTGWLDKRLAAEIYINPQNDAMAEDIIIWLSERDDVWEIVPQRNGEIVRDGQPVSIIGLPDAITLREWPMISAKSEAWALVGQGEGVLISEQLARRENLSFGDEMTLTGIQSVRLPIVGIYPDYGNPKGQIILGLDHIQEIFGPVPYFGVRARVEPEQTSALFNALDEEFDLGDDIVDQTEIKEFSTDIFEQTFAVTSALNILTMIVAGIAMFMSLLTLADMRLPFLAPLWSSGVTRRHIAGLELGKTLALSALTCVLAIPLGIAVAWLLVAVVNVEAFGWRLPLHLFPVQWFWLCLLALGTAFLAAAIPVFKLYRISPARLVKVFADAR